jgi:CRP-like cAMP-binding protein
MLSGTATVSTMSDDDFQGLRERLTKQGEDALGKFAQELLENPLITGALTKAFDARERAVQAQEAAMGALNLPSAADLERLTRRIRSVAQRLEGIEDALDRIDQRIGVASGGSADERLKAIEDKLDQLMKAQTAAAKAGASAAKASASAAKTAARKPAAAKK